MRTPFFNRESRAAASIDMVQAAELLFLQAKKESGTEEKKRLVKLATEILETSVRLADEEVITNDSVTKTTAVLRPKGKTLTFADIAGRDGVKETLMQWR